MVVSQSLFSVLEKMKDTSGNYLLKVDKETGTSETFFVDNFLIVDDTTLGNKGDKKRLYRRSRKLCYFVWSQERYT